MDTVLSYCHHTLCDHSLEALLPNFQEKGVGVINASLLCMGLLTPQGPPDWHPAPPEMRAAAKEAAAVAAAAGVSLPKLAITHSVQNAGMATNLVGFCTPQQVDENVLTVLQALGVETNPQAGAEAAALPGVLQALQPVMDVTWPSGRPENN